MNTRAELEKIAAQWISLWCVPVDWTLFEHLHADRFEDLSSAGRPATKEGFARGLAEFAAAFPDLQTTITGLVIDEAASLIAVRWEARGTNRVRYLEVGPTGRLTVITGIEIIAVEAGRIVRRWGEWDITDHIGQA